VRKSLSARGQVCSVAVRSELSDVALESAPVVGAEAGVDLAGALADGYAEPARDCGLMRAGTDVVRCALQSPGQHHHAGQEAAR
jgi:hypothetical protein